MQAVIHVLKSTRATGKPSSASAPTESKVRASLAFIAHEPFFQFLVLGLLIWAGVEYWNTRNDRYTIHLGESERQRIAAHYLQQFGQLPTPEQLQGLTARYIQEEIFLREGLALNLDKDDEIVRRRIAQKFEFLQSDLAAPESPKRGALEGWFQQNKLRYLTPERIAFSQVYFSADRIGEEAAKGRALKILEELRETQISRAPGLGDSFPGPADVSAVTLQEAARVFGESELSQQLFELPVGQWMGPYRSGFGWHLVYVTRHLSSELPPLAEIRERVLSDYSDEQRRVRNTQAFEKLRAKYTILYDGEGR